MSADLRRRKKGNATPEEQGDEGKAKDETKQDADADTDADTDADAPSTPRPPIPKGRAVIVGGGPAGALAAKALADRHYAVTLFESYPHPSTIEDDPTTKAYVISLNSRGQRALRRVGIDPLLSSSSGGGANDLEGAVTCTTLARYPPGGGPAQVVNMKEHPSVVIHRQKLAGSLLKKAEESGATIECGWTLTAVDFDGRTATFVKTGSTGSTGTNEKEEKKTVPYDLLVGADGVNSKVRSLLSWHIPTMTVRIQEDAMEYQVAILPPWKVLVDDLNESGVSKCPPANTASSHTDPASHSTALSCPLEDGKTLVCVSCPAGRLGALKSRPEKYDAALRALFAPSWSSAARTLLEAQLKSEQNAPANGGMCVWSSHIGDGPSGVVLVGDSGHGMWPSSLGGQGCIAALESAAVLADAVDAVCGTGHMVPSAGAGVRGVDVSAVTAKERAGLIAEEYQGLRHDDATAAVDLTYEEGLGGGQQRQNSSVMFKAQMGLVMAASQFSAGLVPGPASVRVMQGDDVPYSTLKWQMTVERVMTRGFLMALLGALGVVLARLVL